MRTGACQEQGFVRQYIRYSPEMLGRGNKRYTAEELEARLQFTVGVTLCVGLLTLLLSSLYGLLFVYQGNDLSPTDAEFFKLMNPVAMFLTGTLAGIMASKGVSRKSKPDSD